MSFRQRANHRIVAILTLLVTHTTFAADLNETQDFGSNPGALRMLTYVPTKLPAGAPLVVALHGCTQDATTYATHSGWRELAERHKFLLLLPEQRASNNPRLCFNWFNGWSIFDFWSWSEWGSDQTRDDGEALSIRQMIDRTVQEHAIDPRRVYVTGLSAGGAMTAVMLAAYPERFAGGAILAGVPYKCAKTVSDALTRCGIDLNHTGDGHITDITPSAWAKRVLDETGHRGPWPRVSIWHGLADRTATPDNARELMEQWTAVHDIDQIPDVDNRVSGFPHREYHDAHGNVLIETYSIPNMGHGVPVDPGNDGEQCGHTGAHAIAVGICASYRIAKFWGIVP